MIHRHIQGESFVDPPGLSMLGEVFDEVCRQHLIQEESEAAHSLARQLLTLYQAGIRDRQNLLAMAGKSGQSLFGDTR